MRRLIAFLAAGALLVATFVPTVTAFADPAPPPCAPGQHGNPHPGFKPGSCDNK